MRINVKTHKSKLLFATVVVMGVFLLFIFVSGILIGQGARQLCRDAKEQYDKTDCVEALMAQLDDEKQAYRSRNHAIWALGQFGDSRALHTLQKYYTGVIPERELLDGTISQYELKKAINLTSGGINIVSWLWRTIPSSQ